MLLLSEERECGKMKKKKSMFIILCMLTVLAAGTAHATEKERVDPLQPAIAEKILRFHVLANSDAKDDQNVKLKVRDAVGHMLGQKLKKVTDRAQTEKIVQDHMDDSGKNAAQKRLYIRCQRKACQCGFPCENVWGLYVSCRQIPCIADYTGKRRRT